MSRRKGVAALSASPVLVGAVTVLVVIVAVFLSYNANSGLPFVPTYDLNANLPNAANLVRGNDVRIGGARVGTVSSIKAKRRDDGTAYAQLELKLNKNIEPLPANSTLIVRPRSALGLKYVEITPGNSNAGFKPGSIVPIRQATPHPVEFDEVLNTFDAKTRAGSKGELNGFGEGFAGRGVSLNEAIPQLNRLLGDLEPVTKNLSSPETRLDRFFPALEAVAGEVAPVAETQAALFGNLDTTFTALASVARPFLQDFISQSPPTEDVGIREFPRQRPFLRNSAAFFHELRPGVRTLPHAAPILADALEIGTHTLPRLPSFNRQLNTVFDEVATFGEDPLVKNGLNQVQLLVDSLQPTIHFIAPTQTVCNYVTLWFRNISSLLSEGDANGTWQRFNIIATPQGPNNEGGPSSAPANGGGPTPVDNHLHANPYPNTAAPGQTKECEAGNESYRAGQTVIGNVPGSQGTSTEGQKK
ncbi:MAG TPA: MlaD family protein [Thermoleophilaceae bacterium]|jgi:virulence factor Mce-like protein